MSDTKPEELGLEGTSENDVKAPTTVQLKRPKRSAPAFDKDKVTVIFVLGGPGAGKGTQCEKIVKDFKFTHLSTGDLLRAEQAREDSQLKDVINEHIREGKIVPLDIVLILLERAMRESKSTRFLVDGFPRAMEQVFRFEEDICECKLVLYFECPDEIVIKRCLKRGETSGRADDNEEALKKRLVTFHEQSLPVISFYERFGKVRRVFCVDDPNKVYKRVRMILKSELGERSFLARFLCCGTTENCESKMKKNSKVSHDSKGKEKNENIIPTAEQPQMTETSK